MHTAWVSLTNYLPTPVTHCADGCFYAPLGTVNLRSAPWIMKEGLVSRSLCWIADPSSVLIWWHSAANAGSHLSFSLSDSSHRGHHDRSWCPETGEAPGTLGDDPRLPGLHRHGRLFLPRRPCQPGCHGLQVLAVPPGPGGAAAHPAGAVGLPGGPVAGAAGQTAPNRHDLRLCTGHAPLQLDGDGVALVEHLPVSY